VSFVQLHELSDLFSRDRGGAALVERVESKLQGSKIMLHGSKPTFQKLSKRSFPSSSGRDALNAIPVMEKDSVNEFNSSRGRVPAVLITQSFWYDLKELTRLLPTSLSVPCFSSLGSVNWSPSEDLEEIRYPLIDRPLWVPVPNDTVLPCCGICQPCADLLIQKFLQAHADDTIRLLHRIINHNHASFRRSGNFVRGHHHIAPPGTPLTSDEGATQQAPPIQPEGKN
jgi:hypothetical protein